MADDAHAGRARLADGLWGTPLRAWLVGVAAFFLGVLSLDLSRLPVLGFVLVGLLVVAAWVTTVLGFARHTRWRWVALAFALGLTIPLSIGFWVEALSGQTS